MKLLPSALLATAIPTDRGSMHLSLSNSSSLKISKCVFRLCSPLGRHVTTFLRSCVNCLISLHILLKQLAK